MTITNTLLDGTIVSRLRAEVDDLFAVSEIKIPERAPRGTVIFGGQLMTADVEAAYRTIAERWARHSYTPLLRYEGGQQQLLAQPGVIVPKKSNPWINLLLFVATLLVVLVIAALNEGVNLLDEPQGIVRGLPFALAFLGILGAHEFGHYFAARRHDVAVTLPYFIPFPTLWGTFGAFIQLRSPTVNRKQLFDVGVAGPLAGLVIAVPVLIWGPLLSPVEPLPPEGGYLMEGNSLLYGFLKRAIFGQPLPSADGYDVFLHPLAWAGWSGLLVTALNLLPVGQLDGGHIVYALFGQRTRYIGIVFVAFMAMLGFLWQGWLIWVLVMFLFLGTGHPPPLNDVSPINGRRRLLGYLMILIFVLIFVPVPLTIVPPT